MLYNHISNTQSRKSIRKKTGKIKKMTATTRCQNVPRKTTAIPHTKAGAKSMNMRKIDSTLCQGRASWARLAFVAPAAVL